jgi:hypothetical protein
MLLLLLLATVGSAGCARYGFTVIDPPDIAGPVGESDDTVYRRDLVEYRLRAVDGRLVLRLLNVTDAPLILSGEKSAIVDPTGQSRPVSGQSIEPGSFIKLILPPPRPTIERTGPSIHIGAGYRYGAYHRSGGQYRDRGDRYRHGASGYGRYAYYDPFLHDELTSTRYYRVYDDANPFYWSWSGEGTVRLRLVYGQAGRNDAEDRFVFARVRN